MRTLTPSILLALAGCNTQAVFPESRPANACEAGAFPSTEHVLQVRPDGTLRQALVWFPPGPGPHDVVVNLHEFRSSPRTQMRYSGWASFVAESNAIVIAPDAKYAVWNAGECCGRSVEKHVDDVKFLDAVLERVDAVGCTSGRVLATGIGNGGMMAEMWSCESSVPDAVVSVGGSLQWHECRNRTPVPLLHYHGDADAFIPMDASPTGLAKQEGIRRTVPEALAIWAGRNQATLEKTVEVGALACEEWTGAAALTSCVVKGGQDTWPGSGNGKIDSGSELADATRGAWAWVQHQWGPRP